jgi:hypothetical protein
MPNQMDSNRNACGKQSQPGRPGRLDGGHSAGHITSMALSRKKATTIALDRGRSAALPAARERVVLRSEFIRQDLALVLEQYRRHPKPRSAGTVRALGSAATIASYSVLAGSTAARICDTGALIDYLVESAPDHTRFRDAIDQAGTRMFLAWCSLKSTTSCDERSAMPEVMQDLAARRIHLRGADRRPTVTCDGGGATLLGISASASSTVRSWRSPSRLAVVVWQRATCVTSRGSTSRRTRVRAGGASDGS